MKGNHDGLRQLNISYTFANATITDNQPFRIS